MTTNLARPDAVSGVRRLLRHSPVVAILGLRQVGRTTLAGGITLLVVDGSRRRGIEFKRTPAPVITPSMRSAMNDLKLDRLDVVHAGSESFRLAPRIHATSASRLTELL